MVRKLMSTALAEPPIEISDYERENGKTMPGPIHAAVQTRTVIQFAKHPQFEAFTELTIDFSGSRPFYTPDLSVYPKKKLDFFNDTSVRTTEAPLTTVEILSPTQQFGDLVEHAKFYFEHGVKSCWIITPAIRNVTILLPDGSQVGQDRGVITDPTSGLTADLDEVFA